MTSPLAQLNFFSEAQNWFTHWPDGLIVVDDKWRILAQSPEANRILGWRARDVRGLTLHEALCVKSREFFHLEAECPLCTTPLSTGAPRQSGVWLSATGINVNVDYRLILMPAETPTRLIVSFQDSAGFEHNQAEMDKFAQYADHNPAPIAEFDNQGQLLYGNPALQLKMLELGFNDEGQARIFPADLSGICAACCVGGASVPPVEMKVEGFWYTWHFQPLLQETNLSSAPSVLGYGFDITQQKKAEEDAEHQRIAASRDFYAKMMHELRTPLNAIIGFSDLMLRRGQQRFTEREIANLTAIKNAGFQLNELVTDTLDISKIEAGKMTLGLSRFAVDEVVASIAGQMRSLADAKSLLLLIEQATPVVMHSDRQKVRQIIVNLLSNAIKYTKVGEIKLVASLMLNDLGEQFLRLDVMDTGSGIPPELIANLFKSYQQIKEETHRGIQGTGLGLALVEELVFLLGGTVSVTSEYGCGSTFTVILPLQLTQN